MEQVVQVDGKTNTLFWRDALKLEMSKIFPSVKILDDRAPAPMGYQTIPCHLIFNIKMDFTRKVRGVAGGHKMETPVTPTYASVVTKESIHIGFLLAALDGLEVLLTDIDRAYLNAPCEEKVCRLWI